MRKTRLVLADDHAILRSGVSMVLNAQPDMEVVGEASDGLQAIAKVHETQPDVLLLDYAMPGVSGVQLIERLRQECPQVRVLVLTAYDEPSYMRAVLAAGAAGYVVKTAGDVELLSAIRAVSQGRLFVDLSLPGGAEAVTPGVRAAAGLTSLSEREREVFDLLVQGHTNQAIADKLFLSVKTIETYRARIGNKLGIHSRADLVRFALEAGVLLPPNPTPPRDNP